MEDEGKLPSFPQLPTDVIMDIFIHLPARSVSRFRTLSKLYNLLLSQPLFIKNHLKHGGGNSSTKLLVFIMNYQETRRHALYTFTLDGSEVNNLSCEIVDDPLSLLIGSCNGIVCVRGSNDVLTLWNPTTKETSRLPELPEEAKNYFRLDDWKCCQYSFGYDSLNEDYKIVCVIWSYSENPSMTITYMYSHKRGCWKKIESFPPCTMECARGNQFVHGSIHWPGPRHEKSRKKSQFILSLDLANERYGVLSEPASYCHHEGDDEKICVLGGELCFYVQSKCMNERGLEIWMMKKYGVEQSWFQLLTISSHNLGRCTMYGFIPLCEPLFLMKSGEILLWTYGQGSSTYLYNPTTCNLINLHNFHTSPGDLFLRHMYVESLIETSVSKKAKDLVL